MQAVLRRTAEVAGVKHEEGEVHVDHDKDRIGQRELLLIQSRDDLLRPPTLSSLGITLEALE